MTLRLCSNNVAQLVTDFPNILRAVIRRVVLVVDISSIADARSTFRHLRGMEADPNCLFLLFFAASTAILQFCYWHSLPADAST